MFADGKAGVDQRSWNTRSMVGFADRVFVAPDERATRALKENLG
jgi:hypothetical protein